MVGPSNEQLQRLLEEKNIVAVCLCRHDAVSIRENSLFRDRLRIVADPNTDLVFVVEEEK